MRRDAASKISNKNNNVCGDGLAARQLLSRDLAAQYIVAPPWP